MAKATYVLCPGQGAQVVGMGRDFYEQFPAAREVFDTANDAIGFDLKSLCFNGPEERLNQTDISQPAIYVTSVACFRAAVSAKFIDPAQVTAYAGLSLGEYTALHLGGAFGFLEGLRLVKARGQFMQEASTRNPSGMVSILGADEARVNELCAAAAEGEVLVPANFNAPGQIVVSGAKGACQRVAKLAETGGFKAIALKVAGAFHSPLMQSGADQMAGQLAAVNIAAPTTTVYANVTARPHTDGASIKRLLVDQIVNSVRWAQTMETLLAGGEARFIELAPGRALTGLLKKINRRLPVDSLAGADALAASPDAAVK